MDLALVAITAMAISTMAVLWYAVNKLSEE